MLKSRPLGVAASVISCGLLASILLSSCASLSHPEPTTQNTDRGVIEGAGEVYWVNPENPASVVGDADYVFVGEVVSQGNVDYGEKITVETSTGPVSIADPSTNYEIQVKQNLKGNLLTSSPVPVRISGGYSRELDKEVTPSENKLPAVGDSYVFAAIALVDGSLTVQGRNSVVPVGAGSSAISTYVDAVKNQTPTPREKYVSAFEQD